MNDGREDIRRAAEDLAERLPDALAPLARLAYNYRWSWLPGGAELFAAIDAERFHLCGRNPVRLLQESAGATLQAAASDVGIVPRADELTRALAADLGRPPSEQVISAEHPVAFVCAEYGVHVSLPVYSGGLGALGGDLLKEASARALPLFAVRRMYP